MSALRLFAPVELNVFRGDDLAHNDRLEHDGSDDRVVIPFPTLHRFDFPNAARTGRAGILGHHHSAELSTDRQSPLDRARLLHQHRCCPECGRGGTVPQEEMPLQAACHSMAVPGASSLLGFGCDHCGHEWSV